MPVGAQLGFDVNMGDNDDVASAAAAAPMKRARARAAPGVQSAHPSDPLSPFLPKSRLSGARATTTEGGASEESGGQLGIDRLQ